MQNMNEIIKNSNRGYKTKLEEAKRYLKVWEKTPFLEGIEDEQKRLSTSILLNQQAKQLMKEATQTSTTANHEEWSGIALPIVRKILDNLSITDLIGFQPLTIPSGLVFYLDFKYGTDKPGHSSGDSIYGTTQNVSTPYGGFYGAGKYGYSSNLKTSSVSSTVEYASASELNGADINFNTKYNYLIEPESNLDSESGAAKLTIDVSSISDFDETALDLLTFDSDDFVEFPEFTKYDSTEKEVYMIVRGNFASASTASDMYYMKKNNAYDRGDFEAQDDTDLEIPQIDMQLSSKQIVATTKKTKAQFTPEIQQDMDRYHSLDAEAELTKVLSDRLAMETDLEIYSMLNASADNGNRAYWSAIPGYEWDPTTSGVNKFTENTNYAIPSKKVWYETLELKIREVSNKIHQRTLRGGANFIICSADVATIIESIPSFKETRQEDWSTKGFGTQKIGVLANKYEVIKVPYFNNNVILMGYSGNSLLDIGAVYAPYIPLIMSPLVTDATNFTPRKMVMTRFGKRMIRNDYYGKIYINGLS